MFNREGKDCFCVQGNEFVACDDAIEKGRVGLVWHPERNSCFNCGDCLVVDTERGRRVWCSHGNKNNYFVVAKADEWFDGAEG